MIRETKKVSLKLQRGPLEAAVGNYGVSAKNNKDKSVLLGKHLDLSGVAFHG